MAGEYYSRFESITLDPFRRDFVVRRVDVPFDTTITEVTETVIEGGEISFHPPVNDGRNVLPRPSFKRTCWNIGVHEIHRAVGTPDGDTGIAKTGLHRCTTVHAGGIHGNRFGVERARIAAGQYSTDDTETGLRQFVAVVAFFDEVSDEFSEMVVELAGVIDADARPEFLERKRFVRFVQRIENTESRLVSQHFERFLPWESLHDNVVHTFRIGDTK